MCHRMGEAPSSALSRKHPNSSICFSQYFEQDMLPDLSPTTTATFLSPDSTAFIDKFSKRYDIVVEPHGLGIHSGMYI